MATSSRKSLSLTVLTISMAVLVAGLAVEGTFGILLNIVAIAGCVVAIVLGASAGKDASGSGEGGGNGKG